MKNTFVALMALAGLCYAQNAQADNANSIDYKSTELTAEKAQSALDALEIPLGQCKTGTYNMRGGKEGGVPAAHAYQYSYNLDTDNYAQYFVVTHKDFPYANAVLTTTYNISENFNGAGHSNYNLVKKVMPSFLNNELANAIPEIKAIYLLYFDLMAQENADLSGPFTYLEDRADSNDPRIYNSVRDIYYAIKEDIDNVVACWEYYDANRSEEYKAVIQQHLDVFEPDGLAAWNLGKDFTQEEHRFVNFIKLANSLQLRMAMHMTKIEPATAQAWAEEAVKRGVITKIDEQQGILPGVIGFTHPLVEIAGSWGDTRMSASFESLLMSLDHPYTKYLFKPNANPITNIETKAITEADARIIGIRSGEFVGDGQSAGTNPFINYSSFDKDVMGFAPLYFISLAEVAFLRAEGAIRGWDMGGTAEEFYVTGIRNAGIEDPFYESINYRNVEHGYSDFVEDYLKLEAALPYTQVEPQGLGEDWESVTKIGVKWNEADTDEIKLEKIITQKYIALFPDSHEAWTELRRTGYPKLFAVLNASDGDGSIKQGDMIRRIPYRYTDAVQLGYWEATGLPALGGPDVQATRLWWDVDAPNFGGSEGIQSLSGTTATKASYMLDGRKCNTLQGRGLFIMNGKKVIK